MSLKLVTDNSNVVTIGGLGLADEVRALADRVGSATTVVALVFGDETVSGIQVLGEDQTDHALIGIFEAAKFDVLRDLLEDD